MWEISTSTYMYVCTILCCFVRSHLLNFVHQLNSYLESYANVWLFLHFFFLFSINDHWCLLLWCVFSFFFWKHHLLLPMAMRQAHMRQRHRAGFEKIESNKQYWSIAENFTFITETERIFVWIWPWLVRYFNTTDMIKCTGCVFIMNFKHVEMCVCFYANQNFDSKKLKSGEYHLSTHNLLSLNNNFWQNNTDFVLIESSYFFTWEDDLPALELEPKNMI